MIEIHVPASLEYNTADASLLAGELKKLHSFSEVAEWNKNAATELISLQSNLAALEGKQVKVVEGLAQDRQEQSAKPFLRQLFSGRKEQRRWLAERSRLAREKAHIETLIDAFGTAINFSPRSTEELTKIMDDCKKQKEELLSEKKAVKSEMDSIRADAKQQTANTNYGKYGSGDRRRIRLNKKSALRPPGNQKTAIEQQVHKLDDLIAWLERFEVKA